MHIPQSCSTGIRVGSLLACAALFPLAASAKRADAQRLKVVVAVRLRTPDAVIRFGKATANRVPVYDFDFRSAFADEIMTRFAAATSAKFDSRMATVSDSLPLALFEKDTQPIPDGVDADRMLVIHIVEYGILRGIMQSPQFWVWGEFRFIDKPGNALWSKSQDLFYVGHTMKLKGRLEDIQRDDQRPLKEGLNAFIEEFSAALVKELMAKTR